MAAMAQLQAGAWAEITGVKSDLVGEEICFLSATGNKAFGLGCRNATVFLEALHGQPVADRGDSAVWLHGYLAGESNTNETMSAEYGAGAPELWSLYFEDRIVEARQALPSSNPEIGNQR
jgi:hypothetical protein